MATSLIVPGTYFLHRILVGFGEEGGVEEMWICRLFGL